VPRELSHLDIHNHQARVYDLNKAKGWYDEPVPFIQAMGMLVTEIDEAKHAYEEVGVTHDFNAEMADIYIRLLDDAARYHFDLSTAVDIYRFGSFESGSCIDSDLWLLISPIVKAIEAYRKHGLGFEDTAGSEIRKALAEVYYALEFVCRGYGVDLLKAFDLKMTVNWTRPYRHGDKKA
jgi:hypothetical protein